MRKNGRGKERDKTTDSIDFHVFTYVSRVTKFRIRYLPRNEKKNPNVWTTKQDYADVEDSALPVLQSGLPCLDKNCAESRYFSAKCLRRLSSSFSRIVE